MYIAPLVTNKSIKNTSCFTSKLFIQNSLASSFLMILQLPPPPPGMLAPLDSKSCHPACHNAKSHQHIPVQDRQTERSDRQIDRCSTKFMAQNYRYPFLSQFNAKKAY